MISKKVRTIAIGTSRLDYKKIVFKVLDFLDRHIDNFQTYSQDSKYVNNNEKSINSKLVIYFNNIAIDDEAIDVFRFHFDKDTPLKESNHTPDIGVLLANKNSSSDAFFHIECKRLPARKQHDQEYVHGKLGGIQRFKEGKHGSDFNYSAMVGFIEKENFEYWFFKINVWIDELIKNKICFWHEADKLAPVPFKNYRRHISNHSRGNKSNCIQLYHYWIYL
jgi:hypothetical protein